MSAWEYFVGWLLEVTTRMKYWDYSQNRFNLKGRICLGTCLYWGVAAYAAIYWIHPATVRLFHLLSPLWQTALAAILLAVTLTDTALTIRRLALTSGFLRKAEQVRRELETQRNQLRDAGLQSSRPCASRPPWPNWSWRNPPPQEAAHHSARFRARYAAVLPRLRPFSPSW